jgi:hypothetical protein
MAPFLPGRKGKRLAGHRCVRQGFHSGAFWRPGDRFDERAQVANATCLERTCRLVAVCRVDGGGGVGGRHQDAHRVAENSFQVAAGLHDIHSLKLVVE